MASPAIIPSLPTEKPSLPTLRQLTKRQREVLVLLGQGKTVEEIRQELGITKQGVHTVIDATKGRLAELMDECGLGDAALVSQYLKPLLVAETTEFAKFQGTITDSRNVADNGTRLGALQLAARMRGMVDDRSKVNVGVAVSVEVLGSE